MRPFGGFAKLKCLIELFSYVRSEDCVEEQIKVPLFPQGFQTFSVSIRFTPFSTVSSSPSVRAFWPAFQMRWAALLCEQTAGLAAWSESMARALGQGIIEVPNSGEAYAALDQLNSRLERLESVRANLDSSTLDEFSRAHFVRYGAALLSSPKLIPEETTVLNYEDLRLRVDGLCDWLRLLKLMPRKTFLFDDADSIIVGRAVAVRLGIPFEIADGDGYTYSKSLIVSADSRNMLAPPLRTIFPGQVLYSLNLHLETSSIAPDVASVICPQLRLPWHGKPLSSRKITEFVESISNAPFHSTNGDWGERLEFFRARRSLLAAGNSKFNRFHILPSIP